MLKSYLVFEFVSKAQFHLVSVKKRKRKQVH